MRTEEYDHIPVLTISLSDMEKAEDCLFSMVLVGFCGWYWDKLRQS